MTVRPLDEQVIFEGARKAQTAELRTAYLDEHCGNDGELRRRIEALLRAYDQGESFLESPPHELRAIALGGTDSPTIERSIAEGPGTVIGPYKLLQQIGEGGMGVVFMAEQTEPIQRTVALKIIKPGMDTRQVIARFEAERQALAMMDHPNIAKVLDAGTTESGRPYFVMELVKGIPITKYCDDHKLSLRERLELFKPVCAAVQHAHQKGIIHRDIKPSNVLIAEYDSHATAKVIDFGVAKATAQRLTERTMFTEFGQVIGTVEYMSPEQAKLNQLDIDTRSDIYSLGVLLYELLTGSTPFEQKRLREAAFDEVLRIIREEEPPKPSSKLTSSETLPSIAANRHTEPARLSNDVHGDLDWIAMKALEKDRARRYDSAANFAADIERHLNDQPVEAGPPSAVYRFRKFVKRNRTPLAVGALLTLAMLAAIGGFASGIWERRARQARVTGQLEVILEDVARLEKEEKWHDALVAARRAEPALAAGEAKLEIQQRARRALADLEFVRRLEETRAKSGTVWGTRDRTSIPLAVRADQEYSAAFRDAGIDVDTLPVKETVELISARGQIANAVLPALDDWVAVRSTNNNEAATRGLTDVLRIADPDPWRQRVRDALGRKDWAALENLARTPDLDRQPAATITFLCAALRRQAELDITLPGGEGAELGHRGFALEIDILRRAQLNNPADYWINHRLGVSLLMFPPLVQEGIGYLQAATALRPRNAAWMYNSAAWRLAADAEVTHGDSVKAVEFAERALELAPRVGEIWNTLGVAQYRAGDWNAAVESLQRSMDHRDGGDSYDWFFLAMAQWQLDKKDDARRWYDKAVDWTDKHQHMDPLASAELRQFRAEADKLLKIADDKTATEAADSRGAADAFVELGRLRVRQGDFRQAAADFAKAIEFKPDSEFTWSQGGSLLAYLGRRDAFRKHCAAMLERFDSTVDRGIAERLAKLMSSVPTDFSGIDPQRIVALADRSLESAAPQHDVDMQWCHLAKGMAHFRAGEFDSVAQSMKKARTPHWPVRTVLADLYMAMAQFQLGDRDASMKTLDGAAAMMMTLPQPGRDDLGDHFHDYLFCQLARREAESVILKPTEESTTNNGRNNRGDDVND
jgi:serine/threonine protein kinase/Tfp pilus assembly protein PilF